jgi:HEAT repeat protein
MPKSRSLEDTLAELHRLLVEPISETSIATLRHALGGKSSHAVATAAEVVGKAEIHVLAPDLVSAFDRFMSNPVKSDPGCRAKLEIAEALYRIGHDDERVFLRGIRHVQLEPVYGGRADTAAGLRGACAFGLVRIGYPEAIAEVAELLADPEATARGAAAQALAYGEEPSATPLLRLKTLFGDDDPQVLTECMSALLKIAPATSLGFVARFLDAPQETKRESAALALGGSRLREAFPLLRKWWERSVELDLRRTGLLAIAMLKHDEALEFLLSVVAESEGPAARDGLAALALYRHDEALCERVRRTVNGRTDIDLGETFRRKFAP